MFSIRYHSCASSWFLEEFSTKVIEREFLKYSSSVPVYLVKNITMPPLTFQYMRTISLNTRYGSWTYKTRGQTPPCNGLSTQRSPQSILLSLHIPSLSINNQQFRTIPTIHLSQLRQTLIHYSQVNEQNYSVWHLPCHSFRGPPAIENPFRYLMIGFCTGYFRDVREYLGAGGG